MKQYLSTALTLACLVLVISLIVMKRGDNAQHETDAGAIAAFSNQLDSATTQIAICQGTITVISNNLEACRSASLAFSNQLMESASSLALAAEQVTNLNRQVAALKSENQTSDQRVMELTGQVAELTNQIARTEASLAQTTQDLDQNKKDYALLDNRLRRNVAERVVVEQKFYNLEELKRQMQYVKSHPPETVSAGSIYAGLDVEVKSNAVHVIAPD